MRGVHIYAANRQLVEWSDHLSNVHTATVLLCKDCFYVLQAINSEQLTVTPTQPSSPPATPLCPASCPHPLPRPLPPPPATPSAPAPCHSPLPPPHATPLCPRPLPLPLPPPPATPLLLYAYIFIVSLSIHCMFCVQVVQ